MVSNLCHVWPVLDPKDVQLPIWGGYWGKSLFERIKEKILCGIIVGTT